MHVCMYYNYLILLAASFGPGSPTCMYACMYECMGGKNCFKVRRLSYVCMYVCKLVCM